MQLFNLPDVGEGLTEAEIVTWMVKPGDEIKINDVLVEIETAKSLVELPSPYAGTVAKLHAAEGETVEVGNPIITVAPAGVEVPADEADEPQSQSGVGAPNDEPVEPRLEGSPAPGGRTPTLVGYGPRTTETRRRPRKAAPSGGAAPRSRSAATAQADVHTAFSTAEDTMPAEASPRTLAKPPVRKLAKDLGVDLRAITPTGEGGVVTRDDVQAHASGSPVEAVVPAARPASAGGETRIPIKGVRKRTAQAMVSSAFTAPHVTEWVTIDVTRTMELVDRLKADRAFADVRVSPLLVVIKAVCLAARRTPEVNSTWDEAAQEIVLKDYVNLGIAAATPRGLVVPNISGAESMSLHELASALGELVGTAREGRTQPAEMSGGTFTITNVGVFGVDAGTPILNPGEAGILAFGAVNKRPWVVSSADGDEIVPRWVTTLALSFDHRLVDGEQGSRFLADVAEILRDPSTALLY